MSRFDPAKYYGVTETNGLEDGRSYHASLPDDMEKVEWTDPRLAKITRLRMVSDPGFPVWDITYCHGELRDGTKVEVELPFSQLPKNDRNAAIIRAAKRAKVFAKGLGIFSAISTLN